MADRRVSVELQLIIDRFTREAQAASKGIRELRGELKSTQAPMASTQTGAQKLGGTMKSVGSELGFVNTGLLKLGAVAAGGKFIKDVVSAAIEWETAFTGVRKTVDATEEELSELEDTLRGMAANEIPVAANELAGIAEAAGQLGIETKNIAAFTETVAKISVTTNLTADQAATDFARFANIMQSPQEEVGNLGSTVVALGNNMATTEAEITAMALRLAGASAQIGLSTADVLALSASLSSVGIEAEAGGSAVSRIMVEINKSVFAAGDKLDQFAEIAGTSATQFAQAWRDDAATALTSVVVGLGGIIEEGGNVDQLLDELGLDGIRTADALKRTAGAGDLMTEAFALANVAFEENTALTKEAELRFGTLESKIDQLKNAWTELQISIGESNTGGIKSAVEGLTKLLQMRIELTTPIGDKEELNIANVLGIFQAELALGLLDDKLQQFRANVPGVNTLLDGLGTTVDFFTGNLDDSTSSVETATEAAGDWTGRIEEADRIALGFIGKPLDLAEQMDGQTDATDNAAYSLGEYVGTLERALTAQRSAVDPVFALTQAVDAAEEAQTAYNEAVAESGPNSDEARDAAIGLTLAQLSVGDAAAKAGGQLPQAYNALQQLVNDGRITQEVMNTLIPTLGEAKTVADDWAGDYTSAFTIEVTGYDEALAKANIVRAAYDLPPLSEVDFDTYVPPATTGGNVRRFARGGEFRSGQWAITGEQGPELVRFGSDGRVFDAGTSRSMLGNGMSAVSVSLAGTPITIQLADGRQLDGYVDERAGMQVAASNSRVLRRVAAGARG